MAAPEAPLTAVSLSGRADTGLSLFPLISQLNKRWPLILRTPVSGWISVAKRESDRTGKGRGFRQGISAHVYRQDRLTQQILLGEPQPMKTLYPGWLGASEFEPHAEM